MKFDQVGNRDDVDSRNGHQLAIAAVDGIAEHCKLRTEVVMAGDALLAMVAENHRRQEHARPRLDVGNVLADFSHFAGNVAAKNVRQRDAAQPAAHPQIKMIQRAGAHANEDVIFAQNGIRRVFILKNFRTAEFMNANRFHYRFRSSRTISSVVGNGPADGEGIERSCSKRRINRRRALISRAVGTNCSSSKMTSAATDLRFCRACLRNASYKSSGTFLTYSVAMFKKSSTSPTSVGTP